MKIKLYKQFKLIPESNMEEYYKIITEDEYRDLYEQIIHIDTKFFDKIKNSLFDKLRCNKTYTRPKSEIVILSGSYDSYLISQLDDEYFLVLTNVNDAMWPFNDYYVYYKCDQFDGLLKFLKDKKLIKVE